MNSVILSRRAIQHATYLGWSKNTGVSNDQLTSIDVAYMNHREIISLSNNNNNGNSDSSNMV